ncbi:MAG: branched-chain amino acid ABC transporter permease [Alicyclobacillus sp.]|nr:branched-chain amino acid ABC transporter permease [Alicyclobacillus sp.]
MRQLARMAQRSPGRAGPLARVADRMPSGQGPRWLRAVLFIAAVMYPLVFGTGGITQLLEQIFTFGALAMSYDLLLGYTGILSFGHAMFFGTGAYAVAIGLNQGDGRLEGLLVGLAAGIAGSLVLSGIVAFLSLRVREAYFAMITLAVGQVLGVLAGSQALRAVTNAGDGLTVPVPDLLSGNLTLYDMCLALLALTAWALGRLVHSPVGDVLAAIRENAARAKSLGHPVVRFQTFVFAVSGVIATLAGAAFALAQSFVNTTVYDVAGVSLNVLLMVVIGGAGTLYGGLLGAALLLTAQTWFASVAGGAPWLREYMLAFGILYIVVVRFMPKGILGAFLHRRGHGRWRKSSDCKTSQI